MDEVFRALDDRHRRQLLDELAVRDGRPLLELCEVIPTMTRQGVTNHLRVLEEARLVTTRRDGRRKLHYLNPTPIRRIHDRWIAKYTEPVVGALAALTDRFEPPRPGGHAMPAPSHVYQTYVRCRPEDAWTALVDGDRTVQYFYGTRIDSTFETDAPVRYHDGDGTVVADGVILAADEPSRLEMTFHPRWDPALEAEGAAHMAWVLDDVDGLTRITVEYHDLPADSRQAADFMRGVPLIVAGLKTLLETGRPIQAA